MFAIFIDSDVISLLDSFILEKHEGFIYNCGILINLNFIITKLSNAVGTNLEVLSLPKVLPKSVGVLPE